MILFHIFLVIITSNEIVNIKSNTIYFLTIYIEF